MPRLPRISGQQAVSAFQRAGFEVRRQRGSHIVMTKPNFPETLSVPDHRELHTGTVRALNYVMPLSVVTMNLDVWNGLAPDLQRAVLDAAEATSRRQWAAMTDRVARNYERMRANGMTLTTGVPADFGQALRQAGRAAIDDWLALMGPKGREILEVFTRRAPR